MSFSMYLSPEDEGSLLSIDLQAIVSNWQTLTARLSPGCQAGAVVKADAYGLGADRVAPALAAAGCRRFFVASLEEGLRLRPLLAGLEILVLNGPFPGTEAAFAAHDLIPVLNSLEQVAGWAALADKTGTNRACVLHLDTGMARLGLRAEQASLLAADRSMLSRLGLIMVMSHLASADQPNDPLNSRQLAAFQKISQLFPGLETSLAASSGIFLGPAWHGHWVRPGAALYGVAPNADAPNPMTQVVRLQGKIIQLRDVDAGDSVGYGATHHMAAAGRLAIVAAGYADGYFRSLGNRGYGFVGERRVPVVGRVSMDLIAFDVTAIPTEALSPGAMIDLIGPDLTVDDVAAAAGTIGYEVLTALGRRYRRHYRGGSMA